MNSISKRKEERMKIEIASDNKMIKWLMNHICNSSCICASLILSIPQKNNERLEILLMIRNKLNEKCKYISIPSISITSLKTRKTRTQIYLDERYNNGLHDSMEVVMNMIKDIAKFVSRCCSAKMVSKIEKQKGGGRCYYRCSKCKKECGGEWRTHLTRP